MNSVEVMPISLPRDIVRFVKTWFTIYENDSQWVPPLFFERKSFLDPGKNPFFKTARVQCFVARKAGRDVGTIAATIDQAYQKEDAGTAFFGFFEFTDDLEVASALLEAARSWLSERGMKRLIGPFNFNTNHEFGLLIKGFEHSPLVANPYNSAYYPKMYEALGLTPAMDWHAYHCDSDMPGIARMKKVGDRLLSRHPQLVIRPLDLSRFDEEVELIHSIYTDAWEQNWAHVRISEEEFRYTARGFKGILDPEICFVAEVDGKAAGISITLPDLNQPVKKMKGRLFPFGWFYFLNRARYIDRVRVFMLGIAAEYQNLPLGAALYAKTFDVAMQKGYRWGEASLILENNVRMRGALDKMGATIEKTYRNYEIAIPTETNT